MSRSWHFSALGAVDARARFGRSLSIACAAARVCAGTFELTVVVWKLCKADNSIVGWPRGSTLTRVVRCVGDEVKLRRKWSYGRRSRVYI